MKKVFISSVISGYEDRRNAVERAIQNFNRDTNSDFIVIGFDQKDLLHLTKHLSKHVWME